ncbi:hypothetical protein EGR_06898 [Echinococcus granulosus]|uniref:Uncharacterized protein n=1 Tax=Echinococcus granulosus TaxID=6210 RepID=W6UA44_ECHGR|nr:hypothetical protein EGR_06898 [Echinococcus granulosus]EUB58263.1 hypothetical protein EGR_06898 [Echinococcus granulosus]
MEVQLCEVYLTNWDVNLKLYHTDDFLTVSAQKAVLFNIAMSYNFSTCDCDTLVFYLSVNTPKVVTRSWEKAEDFGTKGLQIYCWIKEFTWICFLLLQNNSMKHSSLCEKGGSKEPIESLYRIMSANVILIIYESDWQTGLQKRF